MYTESEQRLRRGKAIRSILLQPLYHPISASNQIAIFMATNAGLFDNIPEENISQAQKAVMDVMDTEFSNLASKITEGIKKFDKQTTEQIINTFRTALIPLQEEDI